MVYDAPPNEAIGGWGDRLGPLDVLPNVLKLDVRLKPDGHYVAGHVEALANADEQRVVHDADRPGLYVRPRSVQ